MRAKLLTLAAGVAVLLTATACGSSGSKATGGDGSPAGDRGVPAVSNVGPHSFSGAGPYDVGLATLALPDSAPVQVWYPATKASVSGVPTVSYNVEDLLPPALQKLFPPNFQGGVYQTDAHRGVPVAAGRFPLVVFTHGYSGFPNQSTFLTTHLASWGFVVAAPALLDNDLTAVLSGTKSAGSSADIGEVRDTVTLMSQQSGTAGGQFSGHVDMSHVAAIGHSLGGAVSEAAATADPRITTFIGMAGATVGSFGQSTTGPTSQVPDQPGMLMVGSSDQVADPAGIAKAYAALKPPKRYLTLQNYGHLVFADICQIGAGQGGLAGLAEAAHLPLPANLKKLATDGCSPPDAAVTTAWPVIDQAVTAQLRYVFGIDHSDAGITGLKAAYPTVVATETAVS